MNELRGLTYLTWLTFRRQASGRKSYVALILIALLCLVTVLWSRHNLSGAQDDPERRYKAITDFTNEIIMPVYVSFLLPILALMYATAAFGDEREERTLVYLLIRPLSRYRIYLFKGLAVVPLVAVAGVGGFALVCATAGIAGSTNWSLFWPAILRCCITYSALFLLFGALFPRPVIVSIVYSFFFESLLGNMPGSIKRIAVSYYCRCLMYDTGAEYGIAPDSELQFLPISGFAAAWVMDIGVVALLAIGAYAFHRKEYRDLA